MPHRREPAAVHPRHTRVGGAGTLFLVACAASACGELVQASLADDTGDTGHVDAPDVTNVTDVTGGDDRPGADGTAGDGGGSSGIDGGSLDGPATSCAQDDECDDDLFCSGTERCAPNDPDADGFGCVGGDDPCGGKRCNERFDVCVGECPVDPDADNDGEDSLACGGTDCNDDDPNINTQATELCDGAGVDEDCDPQTDDAAMLGTELHCGACNDACGPGWKCVAGACDASRRIFLSDDSFSGDLNGALGADATCQELADAASLGGAWRAYIIDGANTLARHSQTGGPFRRLDGVTVANDWADLTDGSIAAPVTVTESLATAGGNAWTGFINVIGAADNFCDGWTSTNNNCPGSGVCGGAGESGQTDEHWDGFYIFDCADSFRLYCVEQ